MLLAHFSSDTEGFQLARLTQEVLFCLPLHEVHLLLAINESSKVRLDTVATLVEGAPVQCEVECLVEVKVAWGRQSLVFVDALPSCLEKHFFFDKFLETIKCRHFFLNWWTVISLNRTLAARAVHEGEGDSQRTPLMLQELSHTIGMEDVSAVQLHRWLLGKLTSVADAA